MGRTQTVCGLSTTENMCICATEKGLPPAHSFRGKKKWFDAKAEQMRRGRILTGLEISQNLRNFKNDFGNVKHSRSKRKKMVCTDLDEEEAEDEDEEEEEEVEIDEDELSRWKKISIFFKLPYWAVRYLFHATLYSFPF